MNLPNKLTATRLALTPVFFLVFMLPKFCGLELQKVCSVIVVVLCAIMELTDFLDGKIARKRKLVTDLGKVFDPFSDMAMHLTFFVCFMLYGYMNPFAFILILWREISMSFVRMLMMGQGKAVAANIFGKMKTCTYALGSALAIAYFFLSARASSSASWPGILLAVDSAVFWLAAFASVVSFVIYVARIAKSDALKGMTR